MTYKPCVNLASPSDDARASDFGPTAPTKTDADNPRPNTQEASPSPGTPQDYDHVGNAVHGRRLAGRFVRRRLLAPCAPATPFLCRGAQGAAVPLPSTDPEPATAFAHLFDLETTIDPVSGFARALVHADTMTIAFIAATEGDRAPLHRHPNEQITLVVEGLFDLTITGETRRLTPGGIGIIPANALHGGRAVSDCVLIEIFSPRRTDFNDPDPERHPTPDG